MGKIWCTIDPRILPKARILPAKSVRFSYLYTKVDCDVHESGERAQGGQSLDVSLDGKVALVTGAGPNIGSGIALALARYGAKVACNDLDLETSKAAVRRIARNGGEGLALSGDVSVEADVLANIAAVLDAWGRIDIVVNNAAWLHTNHILEEDLASFNRAITIAVSGNFLFTKHAALAMIARGIKDSIVSI